MNARARPQLLLAVADTSTSALQRAVPSLGCHHKHSVPDKAFPHGLLRHHRRTRPPARLGVRWGGGWPARGAAMDAGDSLPACVVYASELRGRACSPLGQPGVSALISWAPRAVRDASSCNDGARFSPWPSSHGADTRGWDHCRAVAIHPPKTASQRWSSTNKPAGASRPPTQPPHNTPGHATLSRALVERRVASAGGGVSGRGPRSNGRPPSGAAVPAAVHPV